MSKPIVVTELAHTQIQSHDREWTYEEMFQVFGDDNTNLVAPLAQRCIEYETLLAQVREYFVFHKDRLGPVSGSNVCWHDELDQYIEAIDAALTDQKTEVA